MDSGFHCIHFHGALLPCGVHAIEQKHRRQDNLGQFKLEAFCLMENGLGWHNGWSRWTPMVPSS